MTPAFLLRYAELVSASIHPRTVSLVGRWTLKQVQGDDNSEGDR